MLIFDGNRMNQNKGDNGQRQRGPKPIDQARDAKQRGIESNKKISEQSKEEAAPNHMFSAHILNGKFGDIVIIGIRPEKNPSGGVFVAFFFDGEFGLDPDNHTENDQNKHD